MELNGTNKVAKSCNIKFVCHICDYNTCRKSSYDKHLLSSKHQMELNGTNKVAKSCNKHSCDICSKNAIVSLSYNIIYISVTNLKNHKNANKIPKSIFSFRKWTFINVHFTFIQKSFEKIVAKSHL